MRLIVTPNTVPETYVPYILYTEAKRLRKETGDVCGYNSTVAETANLSPLRQDRWHSAMDKKEVETLSAILGRTVLKPIRMLIEEPMLLAMSLYSKFSFGHPCCHPLIPAPTAQF